jgi:hypothetical protein
MDTRDERAHRGEVGAGITFCAGNSGPKYITSQALATFRMGVRNLKKKGGARHG